mgnify:CR=1 FL=1
MLLGGQDVREPAGNGFKVPKMECPFSLLQESKQAFYTEFVQANLPELQLLPSDVNFALIQVTGGTDQDVQRRKIIRYLGQQGILVRDCSNFQGLEGEFMRVAIKDSQSMHALIEALRKLQSIPR